MAITLVHFGPQDPFSDKTKNTGDGSNGTLSHRVACIEVKSPISMITTQVAGMMRRRKVLEHFL